MAQTIKREVREAAEKAETKGKEAAARKEFEKADDYFMFAANTYRRVAENLQDPEKKERVLARVGKLEQLAKQCRNVAKRAAPPEPVVEDEAAKTGPVDIPDDADSDQADDTGEAEAADDDLEVEADATQEADDETGSEPSGPRKGPIKPGLRKPQRGKKLRRPKMRPTTGKLPAKTVPPPRAVEAPRAIEAPPPAKAVVTEAPPPAQQESSDDLPAFHADEVPHDPADDTLDDLPDGFEAANYKPRKPVSEHELNQISASVKSARAASVVISLDAADFPIEAPQPGEFTIDLSPRFTEHLCKALVIGDLSEIAGKFHKLADNLIRKAMAGDPRDELDLRFSALACREVADRLLAEPPGDPTREIATAREAYRKGDHVGAAAQYKEAALKLLGREDSEATGKQSLHERQASEYLSLSSRLRKSAK